MVTNKNCSTLYIGVTNDLERRMWEHKKGEVPGFTNRYNLNHLVWFEHFREIEQAIACEKRLKGWRRRKKNALIEKHNARWIDLSVGWQQEPKIDRGWPSAAGMIGDPSLRSG